MHLYMYATNTLLMPIYGCLCFLLTSSKQIDLYDETFRPIVDAVLEGYNGEEYLLGQVFATFMFTMSNN